MQDLMAFRYLNLLTQTNTHSHARYIPSSLSDLGQIIVSVANSAYILYAVIQLRLHRQPIPSSPKRHLELGPVFYVTLEASFQTLLVCSVWL